MSEYVYFILCEPMEAVKIGFTTGHPRARLRALQTGCPSPLKLFTYVPATIDEEQKLHQSFDPLHIHGEWFRFEGKLRDFVHYLDGAGDGGACRLAFENALHDVLMHGMWFPNSELDEAAYLSTGTWEPFRNILWQCFGPWNDQ